jgi:2-iminobutanoate/2-iminopropanoate deaminase
MKEIIATPDAPPALGAYAQAVKVNDTVYVSGQLPLDPRTGQIVGGSLSTQTERVLLNIQSILTEAEASLDDVVKVTIYLQNMDYFDEVNRTYSMFFKNLPPARVTVEVSRLPKDAALEMDAIAVISGTYVDPEIF